MGIFEKTKGTATEVIGDVQSKYGEATDSIEHQLKGQAKKIYGEGQQIASDVTDKVKEYAETTHQKIQKNPLVSTTVALGVGLIIGLLLGKK